MISMNEAVDRVISRAHPLPQESVAFVDAVGRVVAEDFVAPRPHPPFAASVMDGYAVRSADCPGVMTLIGASRAGAPMRGAGNTSIQPGQCAYITTGAPLPPGADAVVPSEECRVDGGTVSIDANVDAGKWVRPVGFDIKAGETLVPAGSLVGAHEVGIVAAAGGGEICVHRKPKLALLSTGDELAAEANAARAAELASREVMSGASRQFDDHWLHERMLAARCERVLAPCAKALPASEREHARADASSEPGGAVRHSCTICSRTRRHAQPRGSRTG